MALVQEDKLAANRHVANMVKHGFDLGLIGTSDTYWGAGVVTIAALKTAVTSAAGVSEDKLNFARHVNNLLEAAKTYGVLTDANISTVQGTAAASRKSTFLTFFNTNDASIPAAGVDQSYFAGAAG